VIAGRRILQAVAPFGAWVKTLMQQQTQMQLQTSVLHCTRLRAPCGVHGACLFCVFGACFCAGASFYVCACVWSRRTV